MEIIEKIGEDVLKLINKIIYYILGVLIIFIKIIREIDARFYHFFENKKNIDFKDYMIFKLQMFSLVFLIFTVLYIFNYIHAKIMLLAFLILIYSVYFIFSLREYCKDDFLAYRDFFSSYLLISVIFIVIKNVKPAINFKFPYVHYVTFSIAYVIIFSYYFRKKYARDFTYGKVIDEGDIMKIKVGYDIRANVKPKIINLTNTINAKKGDILKLKVERGIFNLRGARILEVEEICGKEN